MRPPPLPVGIAIALLGLAVLAWFGIYTLVLIGRFHSSAVNVTVPDTVEVQLPPNVVAIISREIEGPHVTINRPLIDRPADLELIVTDAETGEPIETTESGHWVRQNIFGLTRHRRGMRAFTTPDHGRVRLTVRGTFPHEQVFAVGPSQQHFQNQHGAVLGYGFIAGSVVALLGVACCILRVAQAPATLQD